MLNWQTLSTLVNAEDPFVLVTVGRVSGSSPRETGAKMLIQSHRTLGTIGGGNLEFFAQTHARELLATAPDNQLSEYTTSLVPKFDQCCGGVVQLIFEKVHPASSTWLNQLQYVIQQNAQAWLKSDLIRGERSLITATEERPSYAENQEEISFQDVTVPQWHALQHQLIEPIQSTALPIFLFGAGHVGRALLNQLQWLDADITCIDSRAEQQPALRADNVQYRITDDWASIIEHAPDHAYFLVMTHSHELDYRLTQAILEKGRFAYFGLIGSRTKKVRFERQLKQHSLSDTTLARMTCPIGLPQITGKSPEVIAASVTAQLLQVQSEHTQTAKSAAFEQDAHATFLNQTP
ncbi:xanthine dehydrogenase accessory protein XdhC [Hydrogenovibrio thermophilus]|nr:xanthine dehydrogenase accessory protein XdhC [Hydrogenovibrio thermophilus]